ncbi:PH domain-containing protein [Halobaculum sp. MBLA0147]|uniref:PH domain-containing protein n=1 Tax=Halobaculum sp. MBLA0147 TaxID=3079934 RepID=UPI0035240B85
MSDERDSPRIPDQGTADQPESAVPDDTGDSPEFTEGRDPTEDTGYSRSGERIPDGDRGFDETDGTDTVDFGETSDGTTQGGSDFAVASPTEFDSSSDSGTPEDSSTESKNSARGPIESLGWPAGQIDSDIVYAGYPSVVNSLYFYVAAAFVIPLCANFIRLVVAGTNTPLVAQTNTMWAEVPNIFAAVPALILVFTGLLAIIDFINRRYQWLVVTDKKVIYTKGYINPSPFTTGFSDIRNVEHGERIGLRLLNLGKVKISTSGDKGPEVVTGILRNPQKAANAINSRKDKAQSAE